MSKIESLALLMGMSSNNDYSKMNNLPTLNGETIVGDKTSADLGIIDKTVDDLENYYTKTDVESKLAIVFRYKGSVQTYAQLPSSGQIVGDVYNVIEADKSHHIEAGDNVCWNGTGWDRLGGDVDLSAYYTKVETDGKIIELINENCLITVSEMPEPSEEWVGRYVLYTGTSTADRRQGWIYRCYSSSLFDQTHYFWTDALSSHYSIRNCIYYDTDLWESEGVLTEKAAKQILSYYFDRGKETAAYTAIDGILYKPNLIGTNSVGLDSLPTLVVTKNNNGNNLIKIVRYRIMLYYVSGTTTLDTSKTRNRTVLSETTDSGFLDTQSNSSTYFSASYKSQPVSRGYMEDSVLTKTNTTSYTPTNYYNPATKLYVDNVGTNTLNSAKTYADSNDVPTVFLESNSDGELDVTGTVDTTGNRAILLSFARKIYNNPEKAKSSYINVRYCTDASKNYWSEVPLFFHSVTSRTDVNPPYVEYTFRSTPAMATTSYGVSNTSIKEVDSYVTFDYYYTRNALEASSTITARRIYFYRKSGVYNEKPVTVLSTNLNYGMPFMPSNPGQPTTKSYVDNLAYQSIDLKLLGHVDEKENLPAPNRESGVGTSSIVDLTQDLYTNLNRYDQAGTGSGSADVVNKKNYILCDYSYGDGTTDTHNNSSGQDGIGTNYPEIIDGVALGYAAPNYYLLVHVNASSSKPAYFVRPGIWDDTAPKTALVNKTVYTTDTGNAIASNDITEPAWVALPLAAFDRTSGPAASSIKSRSLLFGKLDNNLHLISCPLTRIPYQYKNGTINYINITTYTSVRDIDGFIYDLNMDILKVNDIGRLVFIGYNFDLPNNAVYSVGNTNDLYIFNKTKFEAGDNDYWDLLSGTLAATSQQIQNLFNTNQGGE